MNRTRTLGHPEAAPARRCLLQMPLFAALVADVSFKTAVAMCCIHDLTRPCNLNDRRPICRDRPLSVVKQGQNVTFAQFSSFFKMNFFDEGKPIFNRFST